MKRYSDELYHFGIKGMKWGVRRFQRKDGSLTAKGREHIKTNPSYDPDKEARKAKIKKYAKRAAIGVGVTAALAGAGYLAYKNRGKSKRQRLERRRGKATSPDIIWKKNIAKINGNPTIHTKPIQKSKFTGRGRSELNKVGINTVQRINVPRTKVDRVQPDMVNIDYATLKAKYDKLSNAVSAQQAFLNSMPKSERNKKKRR